MSWLSSFGSMVSGWLGIDQVKERATKLTLLALTYALLFTGSISLFFVGLFLSVGGLDYFLLIDKQSMLASLFMYAAVLSSFTMIVTFVPRIVPVSEFVVGIAQGLGFVGFAIYVIGLGYTILLALLAGCILLWVWMRWVRHRQWSEVLQDRDLLKPVTSVLLLCCLALGYLRGEHLREQPASMIIHLADAKQTAVPVTVIMSFDQGVLVFQPPNAEPRLYPWDRIASIASAPSQGGISQRLRDWRDAVRGWIRRAQ